MTVREAGVEGAAMPAPGEPWTPILLTRWSGEYLGSKGIGQGRLDAELLLAHVLQVSRLDLYLQHDRPLRPDELQTFKTLLKRRAAREPLQYVLGTTAFRELELVTDSRALIPRPETEVLVGEVLNWIQERRGASLPDPGLPGEESMMPTALDVGTGSGAIALSLLHEGPFGHVVATDPSSDALALARENASRLGLTERLDLREGSLLTTLGADERFDVVVSNPPYVPEGDMAGLQEEIKHWEPHVALFAGPEGLDVLLALVRDAPSCLKPGGLLALEVGVGQARAVARSMEESTRFQEIRTIKDLAAKERVVLGVALD